MMSRNKSKSFRTVQIIPNAPRVPLCLVLIISFRLPVIPFIIGLSPHFDGRDRSVYTKLEGFLV